MSSQLIMIGISVFFAVSTFGYISLRIYRSRKGFYITYVTSGEEISKEFDDILFRESVLKSVEYGFYSFAIENLIFFIITANWAFGPEAINETLILVLIMMLLSLREDLCHFIREKGKAISK